MLLRIAVTVAHQFVVVGRTGERFFLLKMIHPSNQMFDRLTVTKVASRTIDNLRVKIFSLTAIN